MMQVDPDIMNPRPFKILLLGTEYEVFGTMDGLVAGTEYEIFGTMDTDTGIIWIIS